MVVQNVIQRVGLFPEKSNIGLCKHIMWSSGSLGISDSEASFSYHLLNGQFLTCDTAALLELYKTCKFIPSTPG